MTTPYNDDIKSIMDEVIRLYNHHDLEHEFKYLSKSKQEKKNDINYGYNSFNAKQSKITLQREIRSGNYFKEKKDEILESLDQINNLPIGKKWNNLIMWDKKQFINKYITSDNSIDNEQKEIILKRIFNHIENGKQITKKNIEYDTATCNIINIDYKTFE